MGYSLEDYISGSEDIINNISEEVIKECARCDVILEKDIANLSVSLLLLDPEYGITLSSNYDKILAENLIRSCVQIFVGESIRIKTLELQVHFMSNSIDYVRIERKYNEDLNFKTSTLLRRILEAQPSNKEEQDKLFKKITIDSIVTNIIGNPSNPKVLSETANALKSAMSRTDLVNFIGMNAKSRLETLENIRQIVCGIRVFNKDAGHCGEGIRDIVADIGHAYKNTKTSLNDTLTRITKKVNVLTKAMNALFKVNLQKDEYILQYPDSIGEDEYEFLKEILVMQCQHEHYVRSLIRSLSLLKRNVDLQLEEFRETLRTIHEVVQYRTAVSTDKVFPLFMKLSRVWRSLLDIMYILVEINSVNDNLIKIAEMDRRYDHIVDIILREKQKKLPKNNKITIQDIKAQIKDPKCKFISVNFDMITKAQNKFCAYLFIIGNGLLIPANPNLGLLLYGGHYFAFSHIDYAKKFALAAQIFVNKFMEMVRKQPEIIAFFDAFEDIKQFNFTTFKTDYHDKTTQKVDMEIQTELHPIPYNKDKNYTWNIWDLRRKAIQIANLKNCRTHSAQTEISFHRFEWGTQAKEPRQVAAQTNVDGYTNTQGEYGMNQDSTVKLYYNNSKLEVPHYKAF